MDGGKEHDDNHLGPGRVQGAQLLALQLFGAQHQQFEEPYRGQAHVRHVRVRALQREEAHLARVPGTPARSARAQRQVQPVQVCLVNSHCVPS